MKYHLLFLLIAASVLLVESTPSKSKSHAKKHHQASVEVVPSELPKTNKQSETLPIVKKVGKPVRQFRQVNHIVTKPRAVVKRPVRRDGNRRPAPVQYRPVVHQYRPRPVHQVHVRQSSNRPRPTLQHSGHRPNPSTSLHTGGPTKPVRTQVRPLTPGAQKTQQPQQQASVVKPSTVNTSNQDRFAGGRSL